MDRRLIDYFPAALSEYREIKAISNTEQPEIEQLFASSDIVLAASFIESVDETGIVRFEKLLRLSPSLDDTLESRIFKVFSRWNGRVPYTWKALIEKLDTLCGEGNYTIALNNGIYTIYLITHIGIYGGLEEIYNLLNEIIPCNLVVSGSNVLYGGSDAAEYSGGTIASGSYYLLTSDIAVIYSLLSEASGGSVIVDGASITIQNL